MNIFERAEKMTQAIKKMSETNFDSEQVELYIQSELEELEKTILEKI